MVEQKIDGVVVTADSILEHNFYTIETQKGKWLCQEKEIEMLVWN